MKQHQSLRRLVNLVDTISEITGKAISWLILVLVLSLTYEVVSRHYFNKPTFWSYDVSYMLGGGALVIGAAMALKNKQHVRVDLFYGNFSPRLQAMVDLILSIVLFYPILIFGLINSIQAAALSWSRYERIMSGFWQPPIYPLKTAVPIGLFLLLIQLLAETIRNVVKLQGGDL